MHPTMQQRVHGLADMRARSAMATVEFYAKIGRPAPPPGPRFRAIAKGKAWHIIEVATGKTKGFCFSHQAAMKFVDAMEARLSKQGEMQ
ncbi:hypothetical protein SAMN02745900_01177 [Pseudomonas sp. URIL14HWK12:I8]|uniref:hypothetical protein n=1 Tax=unclassified Pseudomonas TaxID=196821 RepID=UPI000421D2A8|nr:MULTISPECIES: hypothetical protein [unclassified Pseudomonas]SNB63592.1 hypothetical protein SAMN02745900_01177 [Pseudomonas sp. URIL14HWK12:I8]